MDPEQKELEYVKLWMQQSQLFWSRLQSAALLHTGILAGWYTIKNNHPRLGIGLLALGFAISFFLLFIMRRDGQYMDSIRNRAPNAFPWTGADAPNGRLCGMIIVGLLMLCELTLIFKPCIKSILNA